MTTCTYEGCEAETEKECGHCGEHCKCEAAPAEQSAEAPAEKSSEEGSSESSESTEGSEEKTEA